MEGGEKIPPKKQRFSCPVKTRTGTIASPGTGKEVERSFFFLCKSSPNNEDDRCKSGGEKTVAIKKAGAL